MKRTGFDPRFPEYHPWRCCYCGTHDTPPGWKVTARQSWESPEEGYIFCGRCGAMDEGGENDETEPWLTQKKRYKLALRVNPKSLYM